MPAPSTGIPLLDLPDSPLLRELGVLEAGAPGRKIMLPLKSVDIEATVAERIATVTVKQVFRNSLTEHMEAVYIFPLAAGCAVSKFNMVVGTRRVEGSVKERDEARREYQQALTNGNRAAIMEQERDDVFTVQVGNLPPGEEVKIEISYSERLPFYENGKTELRLPMVVSPRYIPGQELARQQTGAGVQPDTNLVPDASRISPPRLVEGNNANLKLSVNIDIFPDESTAELADLECSQHAVRMGLKPGTIRISLANVNERLNRDFVLRWKMCSDSIKTTLLTYKDADGQAYGVLSVVPPAKGYKGAPRDIVFVVDKSGSMNGVKMVSAVRACSILLNTLGPRDRYAIVSFDNSFDWMPDCRNGSNFLNADERGVEKGERFLRAIDSAGGTELENVLKSALSACSNRQGKAGRTSAVVVITDGEVGNESQILKRIQRDLGDTRLFAVGVDTAVNAGVLKRMANLGGGTAAFVEPGIQLEEALTSVGREIGHPLVTDLQVDNQDLSSVDRASISPSRIPDVFAGRASIAFFKLSGTGKLKVKGTQSNGKNFEVNVTPHQVQIPAIAQLWAKAHIVDLEDKFRVDNSQRTQLKARIVELAVRHSLLTKFTAFVAIDVAEVVNIGGENRTMVQPVEMPEKWEMTADGMPLNGRTAAKSRTVASSAPPPSPIRRKSMKEESDELLATSGRLKSLSKINPADLQQATGIGSLGGRFGKSAPAPAPVPEELNLAESIRRAVAAEQPGSSSPSGWSEEGESIQTGAWNAFSLEPSEAGLAGGGASAAPASAWGVPDPSTSNSALAWDAPQKDARGAAPPQQVDGWVSPAQQVDEWGAPPQARGVPLPQNDAWGASSQEGWGGAPAPPATNNLIETPKEAALPEQSVQDSESATNSTELYGLNLLGKRLDQLMGSVAEQTVSSGAAPSPAPAVQSQRAQEPESLARQVASNQPVQAPVPPSAPPPPSGRKQEQTGGYNKLLGSNAEDELPKTYSKLSGSYGSGVRAQVFEVIVRQAMAGAPWDHLQGPMQANNIGQQEVQAEVERRRALQVGFVAKSDTAAPPPPVAHGQQQRGILGKLDDLKQAIFGGKKEDVQRKESNIPTVQAFFAEFQQAFLLVESGRRPNSENLEKHRQQVLKYLSSSKFTVEAPKLQKFLRSDAIELISSLEDSSTGIAELQQFWADHKENFTEVLGEASSFPGSSGQGQPFWEDSI